MNWCRLPVKEIGLGGDDPDVVTGKELETMSDEDLFHKVKRVFRTVPLTGKEWISIGAITITIVITVEIDKWIRRKRGVK